MRTSWHPCRLATLLPRMHAAARDGKSDLIKQYLAAGDRVDDGDQKGRRPLLYAALNNEVATARLLLAEGANPSGCDDDGFTPLTIAGQLGLAVLVRILIQAGSDLNAIFRNGDISGTPLYAAACNGHKNVVRLLIDAGCEVDKKADLWYTPLVAATAREHSDIAGMLITVGADVNASDPQGISVLLHEAVRTGNRALVVTLLENRVNVDACDMHGQGALHAAAVGGFDNILKILLDAGANPNVKTKKLLTPLHAAANNGHHTCVYDLILAKADVSAKDCYNFTPLYNASGSGHTEVIELLLAAGADVNAVDGDGRTSLVLASMHGHAKAVSLLIEAGCDPNKLDAVGRNVVFVARNVEVLKVLLNAGGSATVIDKDGQSALHLLSFFDFGVGVLCGLFKAGCDPTLKDRNGKTAADVAREEGNETGAKMIDLLIAKHQATQTTSA